MSSELNDFFKLLAQDKKKKKEEFDSVVGDLGLDSLFNEFATLKKKEKEKKVEEQKEQESIIGEITLDSVFEEVANLKKETKKKKVQEQKTVKAFEDWLYSETPKKQEQVIEEVIENSLDEVLEVLDEYKEELEEPKEDLIEKSLGLLAEPSDVKVQQDPLTPLDQKFATLEDLQKHYKLFLSRIQQQLSTVGGGGETRLRYLDDVVGIATNPGSYNKGLLEWNSTTNSAKFEELETILVNETLDTVTDRGNTTTNGIGVSFVNLPVGSVISGISSIVANITRANLSSVLEYGDSANIGIGSYGLTNGITGGNYAVYELQIVPSPTLQLGDIIAGAGISVGSAIIGIGTGTYNKVIITDKTFPVGVGASPIPYDTIINFARAVVNPGLSVATIENTDITFNAGAGGNIVAHSDILPYTTNVWSLGSPARRYKEIWFGTGTIYVQDETLGNDQALGAKGGNFYIKGGAGLEVGEWILRDNTLQIKDSTRNVYIGSLGATADIIFNRAVRVENAVNRTAFYTDRTGRTQFYPPTIPAYDIGGVSIIGSAGGAYQPVINSGGMLHITGNDGAVSRITNDAFGTASFPAYISRAARGTAASPSAIVSGDILSRYSTVGFGTTAFPTGPAATAIEVYARENFTNTAQGTEYQVYTAPTGTTTRTLNLKINSDGINVVGNGIFSGSVGIATTVPTAILQIGVGTAGRAPLKFSAGTNLSTPEAGAIEYDGRTFYSTKAAGSRGVVPSEQFVVLSGIHTLANQTAVQPLFDGDAGPTGGALYVENGTYFFECAFHLEGMDSGNNSFGFALGGNATKTEGWHSLAYKSNTLQTPSSPGITWNTGPNTTLVSNSQGENCTAYIKGTIRVTVPGTLIPQVSLTAAAAAIMQPNSYFKISPVGSATTTYVGHW
jgi:hypothetical protein